MGDPDALEQLSRRLLDAFELEFWSGRHNRARLVAAPLRVLREALRTSDDPHALLASLLWHLER